MQLWRKALTKRIKIPVDIETQPELMRLRRRMKNVIDESEDRTVLALVGAIHRVLCWSEQTANDDVIRNGTAESIDDISGLPGLGIAMIDVGWAEAVEDGIKVPSSPYLASTSPQQRSEQARLAAETRWRKRDSADSMDITTSNYRISLDHDLDSNKELKKVINNDLTLSDGDPIVKHLDIHGDLDPNYINKAGAPAHDAVPYTTADHSSTPEHTPEFTPEHTTPDATPPPAQKHNPNLPPLAAVPWTPPVYTPKPPKPMPPSLVPEFVVSQPKPTEKLPLGGQKVKKETWINLEDALKKFLQRDPGHGDKMQIKQLLEAGWGARQIIAACRGCDDLLQTLRNTSPRNLSYVVKAMNDRKQFPEKRPEYE